MGKTSRELEREIAERRQRIDEKLERLSDRVRSGADDFRGAVGDNVDELVGRTRLTEYAEQRPLLTLASAFGAGVLLGAATDSGGSSPQKSRGGGAASSSGASGGMLSDLLGAVTGTLSGTLGGTVGSTLQEEIRGAMRRMFPDEQSRPAPKAMAPERPPASAKANGHAVGAGADMAGNGH